MLLDCGCTVRPQANEVAFNYIAVGIVCQHDAGKPSRTTDHISFCGCSSTDSIACGIIDSYADIVLISAAPDPPPASFKPNQHPETAHSIQRVRQPPGSILIPIPVVPESAFLIANPLTTLLELVEACG